LDSEAFERLYKAMFAEVFRYARRRTDVQTSEEVVAETFVTVWRRREDAPVGSGPERVRQWVFVIARLTLMNLQRAALRRGEVTSFLGHVVPVVEPDHSTVVVERSVAVRALLRLSASDQDLILMVAFDGLSVGDVSRVLGCRPSVVTTRLNRARRRLDNAMEEEMVGEDSRQGSLATPVAALVRTHCDD
jgi:RNA polymerase sigma-70 factor (ECF subfamily)